MAILPISNQHQQQNINLPGVFFDTRHIQEEEGTRITF
jgi:hypothetical protein